jgi:hypothetical protein
MSRNTFTLIVIAIALQTVSCGQAPAPAQTSGSTARVVSFDTKDGPLRLTYSDGTVEEIPKERGRFDRGEGPLIQTAFTAVQISPDSQRAGWLAEYMMCAQSYPCAMELVIFRRGDELRHISGGTGIPWRWAFLHSGKDDIALHSGFPHGDDKGYYTLWDSESGTERGRYFPGNEAAPAWVLQFPSSGDR